MSTQIMAWPQGRIGRLVLDRGEALNALTPDMLAAIDASLAEWAEDDEVSAVLVTSSSDKAFCAGGDVRGVVEILRSGGDISGVRHYFDEEYRVDERIASFPKRYLSLIDGIAMGGGLGISVNGSDRIVTERAVLAMPETAIGFVPDVGATAFLPRICGLPMALRLGMTGARLTAADAIFTGLATHFMPSKHREDLSRDMRDIGVEEALETYCVDPQESTELGESSLATYSGEIEDAYSAGSAAEIVERLERGSYGPWAKTDLAALRAASPLAVVATFEAITAGASATVRESLDNELALGADYLCTRGDFLEGVRSRLIDKDFREKPAAWSPQSLEEVTTEQIEEIRSRLGR